MTSSFEPHAAAEPETRRVGNHLAPMVEPQPSAGDATPSEPLHLALHRDLWAIVNERFTDADADHRWAEDGIRWGQFRLPESELHCSRVPLRSASFDLVVSEYGPAPWCDPIPWLAEAAPLLRPHGRLVFMTHTVTVALCVPEEGGVAGDRLLRGQRDVERVS